MCTSEEAKQACKKALTDKGADGKTIIEEALEIEGNAIIRKLTLRGLLVVVPMIISATIGWYNLVYRVNGLEAGLGEGGRFTQEEADKHMLEQARVDEVQDARISELKADVTEQFREVNKKLDNIQNLLYQISRNS
jgi:hypothetical protein